MDKEQYEMGRVDAASVQQHCTPENPPEVIWFSPEESMALLEKETDEDQKLYWQGYLSRWD